jgi:rhodanese-related sulfurtransferase
VGTACHDATSWPDEPTRSAQVSQQGQIPEITVDELSALAAGGGIVVVDVRMPDEYDEAHMPGAALIPLPELPERHGEIPDADTVYVICRSGGRSLTACEFLVAAGRSAVNVGGGTLAWIEAGHPVATGAEPG